MKSSDLRKIMIKKTLLPLSVEIASNEMLKIDICASLAYFQLKAKTKIQKVTLKRHQQIFKLMMLAILKHIISILSLKHILEYYEKLLQNLMTIHSLLTKI